MFEKITKKLINNTKQTVKKEFNTSIENQFTKILGLIPIGLSIASMFDTNQKAMDEGKSNITIYLRDIYIYYNEK
jgi:hypothetical protein